MGSLGYPRVTPAWCAPAHCHTHRGHHMGRAGRRSSVLSRVSWTLHKGRAMRWRPSMLLHEGRARRWRPGVLLREGRAGRQRRSSVSSRVVRTSCMGRAIQQRQRWEEHVRVSWTSCEGSPRRRRPGMLSREGRARRQRRSGVSSRMARTSCVGRAAWQRQRWEEHVCAQQWQWAMQARCHWH